MNGSTVSSLHGRLELVLGIVMSVVGIALVARSLLTDAGSLPLILGGALLLVGVARVSARRRRAR